MRTSLNRKISIAVAAALAVAGLSAGAASAQQKVIFGTNWKAEAEHGGYYQSIADGTYKACGLDVSIAPGGPQVNNRILLSSGKIDFLMGGNLLEPFSAVEQGIPTKIVAADFQKEPQVLMTHPGEYPTFESMKTAKTILLGEGGFQSFFQWMISDYGFKAEQRRPYTFNPAPFVADKKAVQQGYVTSEPLAVYKAGGFWPTLYLLADYGFDTYSTLIETRIDIIDKKPDAVKCFVEGSALGWVNYLYGDNKAANALIKRDNPDMSDEQITFTIDKLKEFGIVDSGEAQTKGVGTMNDERVKSFFNKMVKAGVLKANLDYTKAYTLAFVNKGIGVEQRKKLTGK